MDTDTSPDAVTGPSPFMAPLVPDIDVEVRRQMLRLALRNSKRSVPLLLVIGGWVVTLGWLDDRYGATGTTAAMLLIVAVWRYLLVRRREQLSTATLESMKRTERQIEWNSLLAGLMWLVSSLGIYRYMQGIDATAYCVFVCGSVSIAALFMSLVGRSFEALVLPQLGGVVIANLMAAEARSIPLSMMIGFFGITMYFAAREFVQTARRAVRHSLEVDAAYESLRIAKEVAETANEAKSRFLATMSHEIRTPMNGVLGALDLLRRSALDADQRRLVRTAASSGTSLMAILNDVLDHSKIEAGKMVLVAQPFSLHALVASVVALFQGSASSKSLRLALEVAEGVPDGVIGDAQRLKQVLFNLVGNAIKFTDRGEVRLAVRPHASIGTVTGVGVAFEVRDSGVGLSDVSIERLFEPFFQVDGKRNRRRGGSGLGLAISQRIVEAMGGTIEAAGELEKGSTFRFVLRFEPDLDNPHPRPIDSALGALDGEMLLSGRVLLVEDNEVNRMIAHEALVSIGLEVIEAEDGLSALAQLEAHPVDVVLMDCQMPLMDGYAATREIRSREARRGRPRIPVLALTADAFDEDAVRARRSGMDAHLAKPYTLEQLRALLRCWL